VYEYFEILKDTLVLHELPVWRKSVRRKPVSSSKYYFFDVGVVAALQGRPFHRDTPEFGQALETIVFHELIAHRDYVSGEPLAYWRSTSGLEVDFVIGDHTAIEVKATENVSRQDVRSLLALAEERRFRSLVCVCMEARPRQVGAVSILPYREFLHALWEEPRP
jgi:predicted AAA+ superfamily ATPase